MKNKNFIALSVLATLLVCTAFASFANAADDKAPSSIEPAEPKITIPTDAGNATIAEPASPDSAVSSDQPTLYLATQGIGSNTADDLQIQGDAEANLVSERVDEGDVNPWFILGLTGVLAAGLGCVVGVVYYRRVPIKN